MTAASPFEHPVPSRRRTPGRLQGTVRSHSSTDTQCRP